MTKPLPKIIILAGYGLNCEQETAYAFNLAAFQLSSRSSSGQADVVHINDLINRPSILKKYQILAIPGGFSYGDDLGSGRAYANKLNNHLKNQLLDFISKDKLVIGICNGFQVLTNLGLLPGVLTFNDNNRYTDRWVDVQMPLRGLPSESPWIKGISNLSVPIAHGEGKFVANDKTLKSIKSQKMIGAVYYRGEMSDYYAPLLRQGFAEQANPNGSTLDIAMLTSANGKILGTMPHPERSIFFTQLPNWPLVKEKLTRMGKPLPKFGPGLQIFKNAVNYYA